MMASDVMTRDVVTVGPDTPVAAIIRLLLTRGISGVPVVDDEGVIVGMVSEGDLLRRAELGTEKKRGSWRAFFTGTATLASEYVRSHAMLARDMMTREVVCVGPTAALDAIADLMETHRIKRIPVVQDRTLVGIISRANLLRALASRVVTGEAPTGTAESVATDAAIRTALTTELASQAWSRRVDNSVVVTDGVVHLWGLVASPEESRALEIAARGVPGVREVQNHTIILADEPYGSYPGGFMAD